MKCLNENLYREVLWLASSGSEGQHRVESLRPATLTALQPLIVYKSRYCTCSAILILRAVHRIPMSTAGRKCQFSSTTISPPSQAPSSPLEAYAMETHVMRPFKKDVITLYSLCTPFNPLWCDTSIIKFFPTPRTVPITS